MKKKMIILLCVALLVTICLGTWYVLSIKFGIGPMYPFVQKQQMTVMNDDDYVADDQLVAYALTKEIAEEIAGKYDIELVLYENGIATYHTDGDPYSIASNSIEDGKQILYVNYIFKQN